MIKINRQINKQKIIAIIQNHTGDKVSKTTIYIIRHGESLGNKKSIFLGHTDWDITELGYKQADMTAEALKNVNFDAIYSSDLIRAYNTAVPNARIRNMEIITNTDLREIYAGDWDGKSKEEITDKWGDLFTRDWRFKFGTFKIPGGEAVLSAGERFQNALTKIAETHNGQTILIVSHAAVIRSFYSKISGFKPEEYAEKLHFPSNASYSLVEFENGVFTPIFYSEDRHMGEFVTKITYS